ncbi:MAG: helix-turn-helix domain-containing protein [Candidatus Caldarchaeum sp.]
MSDESVVSERVRRTLQELGLTEYEARAYIALVENGPLTAGELSEMKLIPYSKVYEALGSLAEKGFIESQQGRPAKYFQKSPAAVIESLVQSIERDVRRKSEMVVRELMPVFEMKGGVNGLTYGYSAARKASPTKYARPWPGASTSS